LRPLVGAQLPVLASPLGFGRRRALRGERKRGRQQHMGRDPPGRRP
jgi:hypothetical protein